MRAAYFVPPLSPPHASTAFQQTSWAFSVSKGASSSPMGLPRPSLSSFLLKPSFNISEASSASKTRSVILCGGVARASQQVSNRRRRKGHVSEGCVVARACNACVLAAQAGANRADKSPTQTAARVEAAAASSRGAAAAAAPNNLCKGRSDDRASGSLSTASARRSAHRRCELNMESVVAVKASSVISGAASVVLRSLLESRRARVKGDARRSTSVASSASGSGTGRLSTATTAASSTAALSTSEHARTAFIDAA